MNIHNFTTKGIKNNSFAMGALSLSLVSCSQIPVLGQNSLPGNLRTNGKQVETAFEAQRVVLQKSSAAIYKSRRPIGYGVVMSSDGYILTKRSELFAQDKETKISKLKEGLSIIIDEHRYKDVSLIASDIKWDLAILKVDAEKLTPIEWDKSSIVVQGSWVITNGSTSKLRRRVNIGIISAHAREILGEIPVMLGVGLNDNKNNEGVEILEVVKDSGAEVAGLTKGDLIKKFDGVEVKKREQIIDVIRKKQPGDFVEVEFLREGELLTQSMELRARKDIQSDEDRPKSRNDQMSGKISERRNSFPMALQHDIDQAPRQTGGPLLNLSGKAIGINIARANRAESFAIPAKEAQEVYQEMLSSIPQ